MFNFKNEKRLKKKVEISIDISYVELKKGYCLFKGTQKTKEKGTEKEEIVFGVGLKTNILRALNENKLPKTNSNVVVLSKRLSYLLKEYGFPNHLEKTVMADTDMKSKEKTDVEIPYEKLKEELKKCQLKYEDIEQNPKLIEKIVLVDHSNNMIVNLYNNEYVNIGIPLSRIGLEYSSYVFSLEDVKNHLIKNKMAKFIIKREKIIQEYDETKQMNGILKVTDLQYKKILKKQKELIEKNKPNDVLYGQDFQKILFDLNIKGLSKHYCGYDENNPFKYN